MDKMETIINSLDTIMEHCTDIKAILKDGADLLCYHIFLILSTPISKFVGSYFIKRGKHIETTN